MANTVHLQINVIVLPAKLKSIYQSLKFPMVARYRNIKVFNFYYQ